MSDDKSTPTTSYPDAYNGWQNYETWVTALWIGSDPGSDNYACQLVRDAYARAARAKEADPQAIIAPLSTAADALREWIDDMHPLATQANLFCDLLTHALARVSWHEIARHYHDERTNDNR